MSKLSSLTLKFDLDRSEISNSKKTCVTVNINHRQSTFYTLSVIQKTLNHYQAAITNQIEICMCKSNVVVLLNQLS